MKIGIVTATDPATCKARVRFPDQDNIESFWLPVVQPKTLRDRFYLMPDVHEHVVCLMDEHGETGVILGAIYSDADAPPANSQDKMHVQFDDDTSVEYDRASHTLTIDVKGPVNVYSTAKVFIQGDQHVEIDGAGTNQVKGVVQGDDICPYTRKPHIMVSATVKASK